MNSGSGQPDIQRKLVSGLFWVLLANLLVKPLWILGIEVGVQNAVGNEVYGFYIDVFNLAYIFNILLDLGVTNFNTRNIAQHPQLIGKHLSGILGIKICLLGVYLLVTFTIGALMGYGCQEFRLLLLLSLCQFLNSLILYLRSNFEGLLLFRWDSLFSVLDRLLMIAICGCLLWTPLRNGFNIYWFVYAQVIAYGLTALLAFAVIARKAQFRRLRWNCAFFFVIPRKSAPFALLVLLMASYNRIDPILLRRLVGDADAGIYAGAFRLLDALTMVCYLVSVPLLPVFSKLCKTSGQVSDVIRIVFWPLMLFAVGASVLCALFADSIMELLYPGHGGQYVPVFRVVVFGIIPISITYIFGTLLTAGGRLRQLNIFAACTLLLNVAVNLLLIPRMGATSSAWASLTAQSFMALAQLLLAIRIFRLSTTTFLPMSPRNIYRELTLIIKNKE
ncbi:MAG: oligosaccharide flippase family protein [Bacteroidales bacterium]|nr:oligosaccharide flippase family protein [Bacteroidales bacterium]